MKKFEAPTVDIQELVLENVLTTSGEVSCPNEMPEQEI